MPISSNFYGSKWVGINTRGGRHKNHFVLNLQQATSATTRVIVYANDTDSIVLCIYYAAALLSGVQELWLRTEHIKYLPIHHIAQ